MSGRRLKAYVRELGLYGRLDVLDLDVRLFSGERQSLLGLALETDDQCHHFCSCFAIGKMMWTSRHGQINGARLEGFEVPGQREAGTAGRRGGSGLES